MLNVEKQSALKRIILNHDSSIFACIRFCHLDSKQHDDLIDDFTERCLLIT